VGKYLSPWPFNPNTKDDNSMNFKSIVLLFFICTVNALAQPKPLVIKENQANVVQRFNDIRDKTPAKVGDGLQLKLWASDSLAPDPVAMSIDDRGNIYLTRTNRQKNSEFDIRGHRDWMTESISLKTVEERRAFLHKTFDPKNSKKNEWLKDLNNDGIHDWHDLAVENDEIWRLEDSNKDGIADVSKRILNDFHEEITDIAGGVLIREKDAFVAIAPDLWRLENKNKAGVYQKKTSISTGYAVHIGFSGHNLSGIIEGPDGRIYWNMGDIGGSITAKNGQKFENPNSGFIARSNPDGSDFEIFATGLRNTHEFVFDEYGNLISSDNDGDHPGESERLVHIVEGSDAGWRSNWQYGKYTDPKNNAYKVWMNEKLFKPRWDGQAAYIIPPIMNYHNGPTGMVYNPGTALGADWKNKYFLVEFVGSPTQSRIWSFGLKAKGASFELNGEKNILSGVLPTGIRFGPDGALYVADWINGWDTKDYGRVWQLDVTPEKNDLATERLETQRLMVLDYAIQTPQKLYDLLFYGDMRIRQKAQFELVNRGKLGLSVLEKATLQTTNQLARIHGIWGIGQLARKDKTVSKSLAHLLKDNDPEIITQSIRMIGDAEIKSVGNDLIPFLSNSNDRIRFYAAEALGQLAHVAAVEPLITMLAANNDQDAYIRHAGVLALTRIGKIEPMVALVNNQSKALRTAAVLVLRRLRNENIKLFLKDADEYIVAEAARGINDDLSISPALPALAAILSDTKSTSEVIIRRAINAALRVGGNNELSLLINFAQRTDIKDDIKAEALATIGTWASPSVLDRVDGRFRGKITRDAAIVKAKIQPFIDGFLKETNPETRIAIAGLLTELKITTANDQLAKIYSETTNTKVKSATLIALNELKYNDIQPIIKNGMEDKDESVRATALGLLNDSNVSKENLPAIVNSVFTKGSTKEQQQMLVVLGKMAADKTRVVLDDLIGQWKDQKLSASLGLELKEAVDGSGIADLKTKLSAIKTGNSIADDFAETLYGGNRNEGRTIFNYNSTAQCTRCHAIGTEGGAVGPALTHIASTLSRDQILQALVEPSERIAPGFGTVSLKLKDGQEIYGVLAKETDTHLTITTSDAEPLVIAIARIAKRENMPSSMPPMGAILSKREIRDLIEFLNGQK
jgi:quinoprotein glucose dehydrogenase